MTEIANRNALETIDNGAKVAEVIDFLKAQADNELLSQARRDEYALAADLLAVEGTIHFTDTGAAVDLDHWPAAQSFVIRMTEGLL